MQPASLNNKKHGLGMVEVIVGAAIITTTILALIGAFNVYLSYALSNQHNVQAASLLEEGIEAIKFMRDTSWTSDIATLSSGTTYYLYWTGTTWTATTTAQTYIDNTFNRTFTVASVNRDANSDITTSGGTTDAGTKLITVSVSYLAGHSTTTSSMSDYITNLYSN